MPALQQITMNDILNRQIEDRLSNMTETDRLRAEREGDIYNFDDDVKE